MGKKIDIADLVPHRGNMLLLEQLVDSDEASIIASVVVREDGLFDTAGAVPAWIGIEYMAQTVAAFSGLRAKKRGEAPKLGFLLGTRRFESSVAEIPCGTELLIKAQQLIMGSDGMAAFKCQVSGDHVEQTATLSVYEPTHPENFLPEDS